MPGKGVKERKEKEQRKGSITKREEERGKK